MTARRLRPVASSLDLDRGRTDEIDGSIASANWKSRCE
jgi:hypothetical protein